MEQEPRYLPPEDLQLIEPAKTEEVEPDTVVLADHATGIGNEPGIPSPPLVTQQQHRAENPHSR